MAALVLIRGPAPRRTSRLLLGIIALLILTIAGVGAFKGGKEYLANNLPQNAQKAQTLWDNATNNIQASAKKKIEIHADRWGQYWVPARIEGELVDALVDSGAGSVHLPNALATKKLGKKGLRYTLPRSTYLGILKDAESRVSSIEVQGVTMRDVRVEVASPRAGLQLTLLGASWLNEFQSVTISNRTMTLIPKEH